MSANLIDVLVLLGLFLLGYLFWQWRLQEEHARRHAEQICAKNKVQFLDIARTTGKFAFKPKLGWQAKFTFGFSSDSKSRYEGSITLINLYLQNSQLPPFRFHANPHDDDVDADFNESPEAVTPAPQAAPTPTRAAASASTPVNANNPEQVAYRVRYGDPQPSVRSRSTAHHIPAATHSSRPDDDLPPVIDAVFPSDFPLH